jgi:7-cyano-7-deazaguanine synthase
MGKKSVVIFSGGLDSTTCLGIALNEGFQPYPITFKYGQRHDKEVLQAQEIIKYYNLENHKIVDLEFLGSIGGSSLTQHDLVINQNGVKDEMPNTYVPARNMIFLSLATSYAESINAEKIYIGVSAIDYSGYPDCRPDFINAIQKAINLGTSCKPKIEISTPLISKSKAETIDIGMKLKVPYDLTTSCYIGEKVACGTCDSCRLRLQGFNEAGFEDPIKYSVTNN